MAFPEVTIDLTSGSSADTSSFSYSAPAKSIYAYGAGTITVVDCTTTAGVSRTYTVAGGETIPGAWQAFTSTTCSRIRMSTANMRQAASSVGSIVAGNYVQSYLDGGTTKTAAFTAAIGTMYTINPQATFAYTFPAISASNDGQKIAIVNVNTGSTATVAIPSGSDNVGNCAGALTGATGAGPTGGLTKVYTANLTVGAWLVGI